MAKLLKVVNVLFVVIFGILVCQSAACYKLYENAGLVEVGMPLGALINALGEPVAMKAKASNMALWRESLLLGGVAVDVLYDEACENDQRKHIGLRLGLRESSLRAATCSKQLDFKFCAIKIAWKDDLLTSTKVLILSP